MAERFRRRAVARGAVWSRYQSAKRWVPSHSNSASWRLTKHARHSPWSAARPSLCAGVVAATARQRTPTAPQPVAAMPRAPQRGSCPCRQIRPSVDPSVTVMTKPRSNSEPCGQFGPGWARGVVVLRGRYLASCATLTMWMTCTYPRAPERRAVSRCRRKNWSSSSPMPLVPVGKG